MASDRDVIGPAVAELDEAALARIRSDLGSTLAVEASAGTGKTHALVERIVALVRSGVPVENIAVMTFLRAAAEELRGRVADALRREEGDWARRAESGLPSAFLGTIHAFALRLLREGGSDAGMDPGVRVLSGTEDELLRLEAFHAFLRARAQEDPEPLTEARLLGSSLGVDRLYAMARTLDEDADLPPDVDMRALDDLGRALEDRIRAVDGLRLALEQGVTDPADLLWQKVLATVRILPTVEAMQEDRRYRDMALLEIPTGAANSGQAKRYPRADAVRDLRVAIAAAQGARDALRQGLGAHTAHRVLTWLLPFREYLAAIRRREGAMSQDELLDRAAALLQNREALARVRERYPYVLVDEFQDTDLRQLLILDAIGASEAGRMFAVGDPKQAIYGFRGADVDTYSRWVDSVAASDRLGLTVSRRSGAGVVDTVNSVCAPLFAAAGLSYLPLRPRPGTPGPTGLPPVQMLRGEPAARGPESQAREAERIAAFLASVIGRVETRRRDGTTGLLSASDVAILARRRTLFPAIAQELLRHGIGATATRDRSLWSQPAPRDLLALLGALVRPEAPALVVGALRSGLIGWSDQDLVDFRARGGAWSLARGLEGLDPAFALAQPGLVRAFEILGRLATAPDRSVGERLWLLEESLDLAGAAAIVYGETGLRTLMQAREALVALSTDAAGAGRSLEEVLRAARDLGTWADDRATDAIASAARTDVERPEVRLLTVHEAKGLEFPVVLLCDLDHTAQTHRTGLVTWTREGSGRRTYALGFGVERWGENGGRAETVGAEEADRYRKERERQELVRLLYVALTRAREAIVLCDFPAPTMHRSAKSGSFAGLLLESRDRFLAERDRGPDPGAGRAGDGGTTDLAQAFRDLGVPVRIQEASSLPNASQRPPLDLAGLLARPDWDRQGQELATALRVGTRLLRPSVLADRPAGTTVARPVARLGHVPLPPRASDLSAAERARRVGRAVHAVLCASLGPIPVGIPLEALCEGALVREGIGPGPYGDASDSTEVLREVRGLAERGLGTALVKAALRTPKRRVEAEVFARDGSVLILGRADLVFESLDGEGLTVVDFKTDRVPDGSDADALRALCEAHGYDQQVAAYRTALRLATGQDVARAYVLFLGAGQAVQVSPEDPATAWVDRTVGNGGDAGP